MTRSLNRQIDKIKSRKAKKLMWYLDTMGAEYCRLTDIAPNECTLVHETDSTAGKEGKIRTRYWFEHHEDRAKIVDSHPDIQYLFTVMVELSQAYDRKDGESVKDGFRMVKEFLQKYETASDQQVETEDLPVSDETDSSEVAADQSANEEVEAAGGTEE